MRTPVIAALVAVLTLCGGIPGQAAEDTIPISRSRLAELERKAAEADRLAAELAKAKAEIARLRGERVELNKAKTEIVKLKEEQAELKKAAPKSERWLPPAVENAAKNLPPTPPMQSLAPLQGDETVSVQDLLNHYAADPTAADQRYREHVIKLRGVIAEVDKALLLSPYKVVFRVPGQTLKAVCEVRPPEEFTKVYVTSDREKVIGETERRRVTFATVGTEVTYRGRCRGLRDGTINLVGCVRQDTL
jgi:hypothetical protein